MPDKLRKTGRKGRKRMADVLIEERDSENRPVGVGGADRRRRIDELVDEAVAGRLKRNQSTDDSQ